MAQALMFDVCQMAELEWLWLSKDCDHCQDVVKRTVACLEDEALEAANYLLHGAKVSSEIQKALESITSKIDAYPEKKRKKTK